ncbi:FeoB-associated Cys-rich membrane protein [Listeria sp. PSOL-1]|uniref:FeoB-associated Cys-rich membrane protein n=1 Tax=Listeria sp. PSOL-1 TaxID=1844999 RepID=UPI0013D213F2|nr:FeoB-associated Cys-rich membrane protein [Listeria sp. PSOL-1]
MSLIVNLLLGSLIFGYTLYSLIHYIKKSKAGKCAACELEKICECEDRSLNKKGELGS